MARGQFVVPEFPDIFAGTRNANRHLMRKDEDGKYLVPDDEIRKFARILLTSEFYAEPWLLGCDPETVLFEDVITGLRSGRAKSVRSAVNKAYGAEHRILAMGIERYIEWRRAGMPDILPVQAKPEHRPKMGEKVASKHSSKPVIPLPRLKDKTAGRLRQITDKQHLLDEMPSGMSEMLLVAKGAMERGQLLEPTALAMLMAVEQWLQRRRQLRVQQERQSQLERVVLPALQQYDYLLNVLPGDEQVVEHLGALREALVLADGKELDRVVRAGDRLCR